MRNREWYDTHRWRLQHGYGETELKDVLLKELADTEWSEEFEQLMRRRLVMGALRYGRIGHGRTPKGKPRYDRCNTIRRRLQLYEETGNLEFLIDLANFALLLFEERWHPNSHFESIDDGEHDKIIV